MSKDFDMTMKKITPKNFKEYLLAFPDETKISLKKIREIIMQTVPDAEEVISYSMPAFKKNGLLVWIGGHKNHIGLYPMASGIEAFKHEFVDYKWSKGAVQFPIGKPLPVGLIKKIVKFRLNENNQKLKAKKR